ncbi:MAG: FadR family transcriptional regulator [Gammaproteobacteria bacterium]|nr:FadR family transcriptional regulator [Gammaproteobacteria bacterium]MDE2250098.1 FadR family transcriptional regulator [Gammaproteobacteria bacterium]
MRVEFEPVEFEPAYRKVAAALLERITDRTLSAGERLPPELELARQFGVNRSTVREALRELESAGMVRRQRGSKLMMVSRPERDALAEGVSRALALHDVSIRDVWEGLSILEPPIAEAAARARRSADLAALEATIGRAMPRSAGAAAAQAAEFFRDVGEATHSRVLMLAHEPLLQLLAPSLRRVIDEVAAARARIATAQRRILAAIRAGDVADARSWTEKHIRDYRRGFDLAGIDLGNRVEG